MSLVTATSTTNPTRNDEYTENVKFDGLAARDAAFARLYHASDRKLDFQDAETLKQLTKSLLKCDFGLELELPDDRLCPPVPVRWNYIRWMQRLVDSSDRLYGSEDHDPNRVIRGLDIGTGASAIYSLLACASRPQWQMYATDVDARSLDYAERNIAINALRSHIHLRRSTTDSPLIPIDTLLDSDPTRSTLATYRPSTRDLVSSESSHATSRLDFTVCNPPFYASEEDLLSSSKSKSRNPAAICTGSVSEMITPGGEERFITRLFDESLVLQRQVSWYSVMCGKKETIISLVDKFHSSRRAAAAGAAGADEQVKNWAIASITPANARTKRWAVAWSFTDVRPRNNDVVHGHPPKGLVRLPWCTQTAVSVEGADVLALTEAVRHILDKLEIQFDWDEIRHVGFGSVVENVWGRAARRARIRRDTGRGDRDRVEVPPRTRPVVFAFGVTIEPERVVVEWTRGDDRTLFESFCGMLKRSLREHILSTTERGGHDDHNDKTKLNRPSMTTGTRDDD